MKETGDLNVDYIAKLARLKLTDDEAVRLQKQMAAVLQYVDKLKEVDVSGVEPSAHGAAMFDIWREDEPRDWFTAEEALQNAPQQAKNLFIVPKVIE
jgi:aspartyl-tRNA(Asn)/glutamyl-tRNA(Gln) amidotransferase subunit C